MTIDQTNFLGGLIVLSLLVVLLAWWIHQGWQVSHGQDIDPRYYCVYENQYPFYELCNDQRIDSVMKQLLETAKRFNEVNNNK